MLTIRLARQAEFSRLAEIELDAFVVWAAACGVSLAPEAAPVHLLQESFDHGLLLVAEEAGGIVGFAAATVVDDSLYIIEVDVERAAQGRGIGKALMLAMLDRGREKGFAHAVLTTDRLIPFNAPFYARLGFTVLDRADAPAFLVERLDAQIAAGLDPVRRVAMRMAL